MSLISTKTHGMLDYLTAGTLVALPRALGWSSSVTSLLTNMAIGTVGYSLLTRYELGVFKVLPMTGHLIIDAMSGAALAAAPFVFLDEDSGVTTALVALGLWEIAAAAMTDSVPSLREQLS